MPDLLAELFSSRVRAAVLSLMLPRPHLAFSLTDLSRRLGLPVSSLQHECYKLSRLGLLRDERIGNARRYRPDPSWPLLEALTALTVRALAPGEALIGAAEGVTGLEGCWLSGELAGRPDALYLVAVGDLSLDDIDAVFARTRVVVAPWGLSRLELAYFRPIEWQDRMLRDDPFAMLLAGGPRLDMLRPTTVESNPSPDGGDKAERRQGDESGVHFSE